VPSAGPDTVPGGYFLASASGQDAKFAGFDAVFTARIIRATVLALRPVGKPRAGRRPPVLFPFEVRFVRSGNRQAG